MMIANQQHDPKLNAKMRSKLLSVLILPALLCCVGVFIVVLFLVRVLPSTMGIVQDFNLVLPQPIQMLIDFSQFLTNPVHLLICAIIVALALESFVRHCSNPVGVVMVSKYAVPVVMTLLSLMIGLLLYYWWAIFLQLPSITGANR